MFFSVLSVPMLLSKLGLHEFPWTKNLLLMSHRNQNKAQEADPGCNGSKLADYGTLPILMV